MPAPVHRLVGLVTPFNYRKHKMHKMPKKEIVSLTDLTGSLRLEDATIPPHLRDTLLKDPHGLLYFTQAVEAAFIQYLHHLESRIGDKSFATVRAEYEKSRLP